MEDSNRSLHFDPSSAQPIRRKRITRKISRTLSMVVTRVPSLLNVAKLKELGSRDTLTLKPDKRLRQRNIDITLIAPDKSQRNILARSPQIIQRLIQNICEEFKLESDSCSLRLAGSKASVDPLADVSLLEGDILVIEEAFKLNIGAQDDVVDGHVDGVVPVGHLSGYIPHTGSATVGRQESGTNREDHAAGRSLLFILPE
uniref:RBD domain-containing protein n=1 Tax=Cacopsylla melanoneura TaxID=428564 RepID=A0A8D9F099_9HEMI